MPVQEGGQIVAEERRVGYWGRDTMAVGAALHGILHLEAEPRSGTALCNDRQLDYRITPSNILSDRGLQITKIRICKRCERKASRP